MLVSLVLIVILGLSAHRFFAALKLPGLLGMIALGVAIGPYGLNWIAPPILEHANDLRLLALIVILLRAGLGLEKELLRQVGGTAFKMSALPCLLEGFTVMVAAHWWLGLSLAEAGMLGFILAAVTPAIIVPLMLDLKARGLGRRHHVPIIILAGASIDDVFAITLFTAFLGLTLQTQHAPLKLLTWIPLQIIGGVLLGAVLGWGLVLLFRRVKLTPSETVGITLGAACTAYLLGTQWRIAGLLSVMTLGFVLLERAREQAAHLDQTLEKVWFFAQLFLFVLIGADVNLAVAWQAGLLGCVVIAIGLVGRTLGVQLALLGSELTPRERLFAALAYLPKATVQAAIGGMPLAWGIASGAKILAIAVLAIILTASLGTIAIQTTASRLLE